MLGIEQFAMMPSGKTALMLFLAWSLVWKGLALWKAARTGSKPWFIIILLLSTMGILEIIYLFAVKPRMSFSLKKKEEQ